MKAARKTTSSAVIVARSPREIDKARGRGYTVSAPPARDPSVALARIMELAKEQIAQGGVADAAPWAQVLAWGEQASW